MFGANVGLFLTVIAWGSTAPVINELLKEMDPLVLSAARYIFTSVIFIIWLKIAEGKIGSLVDMPWKPAMILGGIMCAFIMLFTWAIHFSNPISVSIIVAAGPVAASLVDRMVTGRRPQKAVFMALPLAVLGGLIASVDFQSILSGGDIFRFEGGEALMIVGVFLWPLYSTLIQRWFEGMSQLRRTAITFVAATPMIVCIAGVFVLLGLESLPKGNFDTKYIMYFVWSSLATSILGTYLWNIGVQRLGIVIATMFLNLIPVVAVLVSMMFGLEPRMEQLLGGVLVIIAVVQAQLRTLVFNKNK
ncbi:MAG: EamA family transporter [Rhodospirillales bacterium]|nr:EamA family transporter [Rhodospirillales bacterium]